MSLSLPILDGHRRPLSKLRLSVTDRCNLRCSYCMPEETYAWLPKPAILSFEELARLTGVFAGLGVEQVRLTGGEPLLRRGLPELVRLLAAVPVIRDLALTTNATRLAGLADELRAAGLGRVTVSLDTLDAARFRELTRFDELEETLAGIDAARAAGFRGTKLNTVVMRGVNDDELPALLDFGREKELEVRFIEYMDVGGATRWTPERVVSRAEMLERIRATHGAVEELADPGSNAPAERFRLAEGTTFGIIASTTAPFCARCDRGRVTADGHWYGCLYATEGLDLAAPLRSGASDAELATALRAAWGARIDRGAEERLAPERRPLDRATLERDPHLEMHTRGG